MLIDARDIAVNPDNMDIVVPCYFSSQVKVLTWNGEFKFAIDTTHGLQPGRLSHPWQVTVNSQGTTYFVTDHSKHVKCFDSTGRYKAQWVSSCPQASCSPYLVGLAMDHESHVFVGDANNMCINKHTENGTYLSSIKVGIQPWHIAVTSLGTIIVVLERHKSPQIVSNTGEVICTLKHPVDESKWNQWGVHCYEDSILIANRTASNILCYAASGNYLGEITLPGLSYPTGVTMTPDGKRLLVCDSLISIHVYSL